MILSAILVVGASVTLAVTDSAPVENLSRVTRDSNPDPAPVYKGDTSSNTVDISSPVSSSLQQTSHPKPVYKPPRPTTTPPPNHKLIVGNWIAQWDTKYKAWFYYNINTEKSTWVKPEELNHIAFKDPDNKYSDLQNSIETSAYSNGRRYGRPYKRPYSANANRRTIVESGTDEFFGLDTTTFKKEGFAAGFMNKLSKFYEDTGKDYVSDLYSDAMSDYFGGLVQLVGWFLMGSSTLIFHEIMKGVNNGKRSFGDSPAIEYFTGRTFEEADGTQKYSLPFMEDILGLKMSIPIDESLSGCYKDRESCVNKDFPAEVDHLLGNMIAVKDFFWSWLELSEKIGTVINGDNDFDDDYDET